MASVEVKRFDSPDEVREFEGKGKADVVNVGGRIIGRGTFEPGWKWSENVKPIAGTERKPLTLQCRAIRDRDRLSVELESSAVGEFEHGRFSRPA